MRCIIGADGGGTKTALQAYEIRDGRLQPVGESVVCEGINYNFIGVEEAAARFLRGVRAALPPDGELAAVGLGDPACDDQVENEQSRRFRHAVEDALRVPFIVRSDVYMALWGLTEGRPGCMVVSGTGSMGIGLDAAGRTHAVGGWGRITGDEGSGWWIAREALTAALRAADGLEPPTALLDAALAWAGVQEPRALIGFLYPPDGEREIAVFARSAADCAAAGDPAARAILRRAGEILAGYALRLSELCGCTEAGIGGSVLTKNTVVRDEFTRILERRGLRVREADRSPEEAAAACAWALLHDTKEREAVRMLAVMEGAPAVAPKERRWPVSGQADRGALKTALESLQKGGHAVRERFEARFAADCGVKYAFAVSNGTVSLELILRAMGIGHGDEVILPPYTFIATVSSILFAGATPVFADIDPGTCNLSPDSVREKLTERTRAIVAVAVAGRSPDLDTLGEIARESGAALIVDGAQGVGAEWRGKSIFACGDAASLSCQNSKNLTCGEGGMITTNRDDLAAALRDILAGRGEIAQDAGLPELQAALLESQYQKLPGEMRVRSENTAYLAAKLAPLDIVRLPDADPRLTMQAYHLLVLLLNGTWVEKNGVDRAQIIRALHAEGLPVVEGYMPLYTFPCLKPGAVRPLIGGEVDLSPLPGCETVSYREGLWLTQDWLLGTKEDMDGIAAAFEKLQNAPDVLRTL